MSTKLRSFSILFTALLVAGAVAAVVFYPFFESDPPQIEIDNPPAALGVSTTIRFRVTDGGRGLRMVRAYLTQGQKTATLLERNLGGGIVADDFEIRANPLALGFSQGPAVLRFEAADNSFRGWGSGNQSTLSLPLIIDTIAPRVSQLGGIVYINRGGSAMAVYQLSETGINHGVTVGELAFAGCTPWPDKPKTAACFFAYPVQAQRNEPVRLWAADAAGNQVKANLSHRLRWREFRHSDINLSDRFLEAISQRFAAGAPQSAETPLAVFKWVNEQLRTENDARIRASLGSPKAVQGWHGPMLRAMGGRMAGFGDHRTYFYKGKKESQALHLGIDLANTERSPVPAAAEGQVVFADMLGIYGNCVVLDHGMGVYSLYGHMSSLRVNVGDHVGRGAMLGLSGATGLALGDHLHFSVLIQGSFVDPTEWWDSHWLEDNINLRYEQAGVAPPFQAGTR